MLHSEHLCAARLQPTVCCYVKGSAERRFLSQRLYVRCNRSETEWKWNILLQNIYLLTNATFVLTMSSHLGCCTCPCLLFIYANEDLKKNEWRQSCDSFCMWSLEPLSRSGKHLRLCKFQPPNTYLSRDSRRSYTNTDGDPDRPRVPLKP